MIHFHYLFAKQMDEHGFASHLSKRNEEATEVLPLGLVPKKRRGKRCLCTYKVALIMVGPCRNYSAL